MTADERIEALLKRAGCPMMVVHTTEPTKVSLPVDELVDPIDRLEAALENALNERDAAIRDLHRVDLDCDMCDMKDKFEEMSAIINETDPITISYYKGLNEFYDLGSRPQKFVLEDARPVKAVNRNDETICYLTGKKEDGTTVKIAISHDKFEEIKEVTKKNDTIIVHYLLGSDGFFEIEVVE